MLAVMGSIDYVVLDYGGLVGIGDKYFAVPWEAMDFSPDRKKLLLAATKKDLKEAPGFDKNHWPNLSDKRQSAVIYEFYAVPEPTSSVSSGNAQRVR